MKSEQAPSAAIPQPDPRLLLANLPDLDSEAPVQGLMNLARQHGPIYKLDVLGRTLVIVSSQALVNEVCDESRFQKRLHAPLVHVRDLAGDGLFTARNDEPNWAKAHRLLMPAFGPLGIRSMFDRMLDIADQMCVRWERFGEGATIDVADHMTRLTLDTIALCAFDTRFNSFYQNEMHPFVGAMVDALTEAGARGRRPELASRLMLPRRRRYEADIRQLHALADALIAARKAHPHQAHERDLLDIMLDGRDPQTGESLSDENVRFQLVTFLIAGHETTSGLLSFATYLLLRNPQVLAKARAEVDAVLGSELPRADHLGRLKYIEQLLMEALRIWPTAPAFALKANEDTVIGGRWPIRTSDIVLVLTPMLHRDPTVWGDDVEAFRPERFAPESAANLPPNAWKPFGNGARACIGRMFAMQEATLVIAMMLQRFDLIEDDPAYQLVVRETLTLKPEGLRIRAKVRSNRPFARPTGMPAAPQVALHAGAATVAGIAADAANHAAAANAVDAVRLTVLYGSNTGSSEAFAQRIAAEAPARGFAPVLATLDEYASGLPTEGAVVIVTASYEGKPPDNARQFLSMVESAAPDRFDGVRYAVLGCGNRQWARTWQAIPRRVDEALAAAGASRIHQRGEADAGSDFFGAVDEWRAGLWPALAQAFGLELAAAAGEADSPLSVEIVRDGRSAILRQADMQHGEILENRELVDLGAPGARSKRHLAISLPEGMSYRTGDYLTVLPRNPLDAVERALRRLDLAWDTRLVIHSATAGITSLPVDVPIAAGELFSDFVELSQPVTRAQVTRLALAARCPPEQQQLRALAEPQAYDAQLLATRTSLLDLLERFPSCDLPIAEFVSALPPMRARQYSISSSPLDNPRQVTLTVAVVNEPAHSGKGHFKGVASTTLAATQPGQRLPVAVRPSDVHFHPPASIDTPIVMVCAGTGIAPFRGFIQQRALQATAGQKPAPALLFFGCSHPQVDDLYRAELDAWEAAGIVRVHRAYSSAADGSPRYVQDRLWLERAEVGELFRLGAHVYVCGDGKRMAPAVRETFVAILREATGSTAEEASVWADRLERESGRYVADVFA